MVAPGPGTREVPGDDVTPLVTVVVSHPVRAQDEPAFLDWQRRMTDAERRSSGHRGTELLRPVPGVQDDWVVVSRFATERDLEDWLASDARRRMIEEGRRFREFRLQRAAAGFGTWFTSDGAAADTAAPRPWKTALSVLAGLYPTVVLLTLALGALWGSAPLWASLLVGNVLSVGLLTWVVMPGVTRALRAWLEPGDRAVQPRTDVVGTLGVVAFLAAAALVFSLVT